ncbi:single-stranded-DNA-specific exonuclease RecJ [PVC group bacterium]|nr:single-stranded-DNA-specific exonuclease RecJ [PVC group bacterium]
MKGLTKRWKPPKASDPRLGLVGRVLEARGFETKDERDAFLNPSMKDLEKPSELDGAIKAAKLLVEAVRANKRILIFGDYDADGITACAVLYHIITAASGREGPASYIPDRLDEGYGIHPDAIEKFASQGIDLVITVDCGITAIEAAEKAKELDITLIITDHHTRRKDGQLPSCDAIVHPALDGKPTTAFAGVGVAYQVAWAFAEVWSDSPIVNEKLRDALLDMVSMTAVGTIADMVPLKRGNRIFAKWGLQMLPTTKNNGLRAIMNEIKTPTGGLSTTDVSFGIAPLINAAGRMSHAAIALDLLTHLEGELAQAAASDLSELNRKRQLQQREIEEEAQQMIEEGGLADPSNRCIVLHKEEWPRGIIGICAGQLVGKANRPIIMLATEGENFVGSARSIPGYSILEGLQACESLLVTYGGHAAAAGITVHRDNFDSFVKAITAHANSQISEDELVPSLAIDTIADILEVTLEAACEIAKIGPFGIGNPTPRILINDAKVIDCNTMGQNAAHLTVRLSQGNGSIRCVWWNQGEMVDRIHRGETIDLVATITINEYRGSRSSQLKIEDVKLPSS